MIRAEGLIKKFGGVTALDSLSLEVEKGEIFGIVGPDGAGKSTLLRILAGILLPDGGSATVSDVDVLKHPYRIKELLAYMPQKFGLYEDLTVEENIFFFGRIFGESSHAIRRSLGWLYDFSRLGPFKDRYAGKLSGGMKQKLGLVCCLVHQPSVILLDEPTNGVDPVSRREFWKILYSLLSRKVTILVSTAYLDEAERCNRIAMIHEGRLISQGTAAAVKGSIRQTMLEIHVSGPVWESVRLMRSRPEFALLFYEGDSIKLFTETPVETGRSLRTLFRSEGIKATILRESPNLENSFIQLVSQRGRE